MRLGGVTIGWKYRFSESLVLPLGTEDEFRRGMRWVLVQVIYEYYMRVRGGYASCFSPARKIWDRIPLLPD